MLATFEYDHFDRRSLLLRGNGRRTIYEYDRASRISALVNTNFGSAADVRFEFTYNPASQIVTRWSSNDSYAWTGHFNENRTGTANGLNQLTQVGAKSLSHDARGNVTSFGAKSFTYDSENMMKTGPNGTTLSYDPAMRLQQVTSGASTRLAYDGLDRILEADGANAVQRRYVFGPGIDEPLVWYEGSGTTDRRFLENDERGSVVLVADTAGATLATNRYDEYGQHQATNLGKFGYTGQAWLPTVGEWYYKARNYDPELGRFLQTDPIKYEGGINLYAYVGNEPINLIDPLGLQPDFGCSGNEDVCGTPCEGVWIGSDLSGWTCGRPFSLLSLFAEPIWDRGVALTVSTADLIAEIADEISQVFCAIPPIEVTGGADTYLGIGASGSLGGSFDIRTLQVRGVASATLGVGYGGGMGVGVGPGSTEAGGTSEYTGTAAYGPVSITASKNGFSSVGTGPKFGPQAGIWAGKTWNVTTEASPNLTGGCGIQ